MTLDLNAVRADFAAYLASNASRRHSLDAALMHVVEAAYQKGLNDALQVPAVLRDPIPDLDGIMEDGNGGANSAELAAAKTAGISENAGSAGQGESAEIGNPATASQPMKGGPLARLAAMWCNEPRFQTWLSKVHAAEWQAISIGHPAAETAAACIRMVCGINSRAELDNYQKASRVFNERIRLPYSNLLKTGK